MKVSERIAELAAERGLNYSALSTLVGVTAGQEPNDEQIAQFADLLKTSPDELKKDKEPELFELSGVEIFRAGTWNGDKYTEQDLDDMVAAFENVGYRPPLKMGHAEKSGAPAYGWIKAIRKVGDKLVADFMDLPKKVHDAIKERRFDTVSAEIFWNFKRAGRVFRRALKAVALLGAEIPGVAGLKPLRDSFTLPPDSAAHCYSISHEEMQMSADLETLQKQLKDANDKIAELSASNGNADEIKRLKEDNEAKEKRLTVIENERKTARIDAAVKACTLPAYQPMFRAMFEAAVDETKTYTVKIADKEDRFSLFAVAEKLRDQMNKDAAKLFKELASNDAESREEDDDASTEVDRKTREYMDKHPAVKDYAEAMRLVLKADRELAQRYSAN